jgi:hypothetical protein
VLNSEYSQVSIIYPNRSSDKQLDKMQRLLLTSLKDKVLYNDKLSNNNILMSFSHIDSLSAPDALSLHVIYAVSIQFMMLSSINGPSPSMLYETGDSIYNQSIHSLTMSIENDYFSSLLLAISGESGSGALSIICTYIQHISAPNIEVLLAHSNTFLPSLEPSSSATISGVSNQPFNILDIISNPLMIMLISITLSGMVLLLYLKLYSASKNEKRKKKTPLLVGADEKDMDRSRESSSRGDPVKKQQKQQQPTQQQPPNSATRVDDSKRLGINSKAEKIPMNYTRLHCQDDDISDISQYSSEYDDTEEASFFGFRTNNRGGGRGRGRGGRLSSNKGARSGDNRQKPSQSRGNTSSPVKTN